jgi:hypothetical protein
VYDLLAFDQALRAGKLLKPESLNRMMQPPILSDGEPARYGQGLAVHDSDGTRIVSHTGSAWSFLSYWRFGISEEKYTVIVFSNVRSQPNPFRAIYTAINKILAGETYDDP